MLNSALAYGSRGYRFESCQGHKGNYRNVVPFLFYVYAVSTSSLIHQ